MNALMEAGYLAARNGSNGGTYPDRSPVSLNYLDRVNTYQVPVTWGRTKNDSSEAFCRQWVRNRIAAWKEDGEWADWYDHTLADWDSAHVDWAIDEIVSDGGVWIATFGEIAEYVRRFHVTVENPVEGWNDSLTASAPLHGLPDDAWVYVVAVAYDSADNESAWSNEVDVFADGSPTGMRVAPGNGGTGNESGDAGKTPFLAPCRPNPFNPATVISFVLGARASVHLSLYDVRGASVATLIDGEAMAAGAHEVVWNGRSDGGRPVSSGTYFATLRAGDGAPATRRLVVVR